MLERIVRGNLPCPYTSPAAPLKEAYSLEMLHSMGTLIGVPQCEGNGNWPTRGLSFLSA